MSLRWLSNGRMPRHAAQPTARLGPFKQVAHETGLAYTTLRDICLRGEIPIVRVGRALYLNRADVDRWIVAHTERVS